VEADPLAEGERPGQAITRGGPARREGGHDVGRSVAVGHERVENLTSHEGNGPFEAGRGIEGGGQTDDADPNLLPRLGVEERRPADERSPRRDDGDDGERARPT
jgi:hypothetical protein